MLGGPADVALRICFLDLSSNPVDDKLFFLLFFYFFLETVKKLNNRYMNIYYEIKENINKF